MKGFFQISPGFSKGFFFLGYCRLNQEPPYYQEDKQSAIVIVHGNLFYHVYISRIFSSN